MLCAQLGTPKVLRTDNGTAETFTGFCIQNEMKREFTAPYLLHEIGVRERRWPTIVEMAREPNVWEGLWRLFFVLPIAV